MIYEIQLTKRNKTHFFIKIYLSHFILERGTQFVVSLRDRWRDIYSERGFPFASYLLPIARGWQRLHSLASRIVRDDTNASDRLRIPGLTLDSDWTDCLNLTAFFSFWLHTCSTGLPRRTVIPLLTNHNVTACQSTCGHQERTQNPCQQSLYNINNLPWLMCPKTKPDQSVVECDPKALFSILTTPRRREGPTPFSELLHLLFNRKL